MKNMSKAAGIPTIYTNHCTRATVSKALSDAQFDRSDIVKITGHRDTRSLDSYIGNASSSKKRALSKTLSNFTSLQNENKENSFAIQDQQKEPISSNFDKKTLILLS